MAMAPVRRHSALHSGTRDGPGFITACAATKSVGGTETNDRGLQINMLFYLIRCFRFMYSWCSLHKI